MAAVKDPLRYTVALTSGGEKLDNMLISSLSTGEGVETLDQLLAAYAQIGPLLDSIPDLVFFVKDTDARYRLVNWTLVQRCGRRSREELLGRRADEIFPASYGPAYTEQDRRVLSQGRPLEAQLELHLYPGREPGWCMTRKLALRSAAGEILGMAGTSRDLQAPLASHPAYEKVAAVDRYIQQHFADALTLKRLTQVAGGLSVAQLERLCKRIFHLSPRQMIHRTRLEHASSLLQTDLPITEVALQCGYSDHSAFSRQFRAMTGLSPSQYRSSRQLN